MRRPIHVNFILLVALATALALNGIAQESQNPPGPLAPNQAAPAPTDVQVQKLLDQLKSPEFEDRLAALHQLVGRDKALPILKDGKVRAALIDLLERETINGKNPTIWRKTHASSTTKHS